MSEVNKLIEKLENLANICENDWGAGDLAIEAILMIRRLQSAILEDAISTLQAVKMIANSDDWNNSAGHFSTLAHETILRLTAIAR